MNRNTLILIIPLVVLVTINVLGFVYFQPNAHASIITSPSNYPHRSGQVRSALDSFRIDPQANALSHTANARVSLTPQAQMAPFEAEDLLAMSGKVIAEGQNKTSDGTFGLTSYRIEEIDLNPAAKVTVNDQTRVVSKAWKVSITGGPFNLHDARATLWSNDQLLGYASNTSLDAISAITLDPRQLTQGRTLSLSYDVDDTIRESIPERMDVNIKP